MQFLSDIVTDVVVRVRDLAIKASKLMRNHDELTKRFPTELRDNPAVLSDMRRIAKYSFIAHKSVNHLDLSICEYSTVKKKEECRMTFTEEGCRKTDIRRQLLYRYHLDFSKRREKHLKLVQIEDTPIHGRQRTATFHFNEVTVEEYLYQDALASFIYEGVRKSNKQVELLIRYLELIKSVIGDFERFPQDQLNYFLYKLYKGCEDSYIVKEFLTLFNFEKWVSVNNRPNIFEYLMEHAQLSGYLSSILRTPTTTPRHISILSPYQFGIDVFSLNDEKDEFIHLAFKFSTYQMGLVFLKFIDAPKFYEEDFKIFRQSFGSREIRNHFIHAHLRGGEPSVLVYNRRNFLLLQIIDAFERPLERAGANEVLRMLWRSIPDAFITWEELISTYGDYLSLDGLTRVGRSYREVFGEAPSVAEPRSLQHYCRTTIKKVLFKNFQLPGGISNVGLPNRLQAFVRLEM